MFQSIPFEIKIIVLTGIVLILLKLLKRKGLDGVNKNANPINPFSMTTRLNGKQIKQLQDIKKYDR